jgi:hypothetical protein
MFEKHIDREEDRGLILYLDNKLEATEIHMKTNFQENLFVKIKLNQTDKLLVYTSVIPMMFGLLSLVLAMSSAILLNNWSAFV